MAMSLAMVRLLERAAQPGGTSFRADEVETFTAALLQHWVAYIEDVASPTDPDIAITPAGRAKLRLVTAV